jgi:phosphoribosylformylglycinamidine synthase
MDIGIAGAHGACRSRAKLNALGKIFAEENVSFSVIGRFTDTKRLRVLYHKEPVVDLDMRFLHKGVPKIKRPAVYKPRRFKEMKLRERASYNEDLLKILSSLNIASKEWIIRQYDHEVQGGSVIKPLLGKTYDGPSDAAVVRPRLDSTKALAIGCGINPLYGEIDPYWMAASSIDEAVRQVVAVGGSIHRTALLDNFCWADVEDPYVLGDLVRASQACYDIAKKYGLVFISGKDSLNNEFHYKNKRIAIPPTLLISSLAVLDDARRTTTMEFKRQGNPVFLVGTTYEEMGGSAYYHLYGYKGTRVPRVFPERAKKLCHALTAAIAREAVVACHDCSDGGFAVALAEMAFAGGLGITADLRGIKTKLSKSTNADLAILFSESNSRFIVEVDKDKVALFRKMCAGIPLSFVGETNASGDFAIHGIRGARKIFLDTSDLKSAWQSTFGGLV